MKEHESLVEKLKKQCSNLEIKIKSEKTLKENILIHLTTLLNQIHIIENLISNGNEFTISEITNSKFVKLVEKLKQLEDFMVRFQSCQKNVESIKIHLENLSNNYEVQQKNLLNTISLLEKETLELNNEKIEKENEIINLRKELSITVNVNDKMNKNLLDLKFQWASSITKVKEECKFANHYYF